ncbi:MAG: TetR/AcrR family transcriptional regulator [Betaproteobacteria bacterium]|nr:TetR/AcrR family transcriptional regulator [Betaproteobacteria bacterium]
MARTRAADYEQQRDAILERAARAFAENGFPSSSIAAIAAACGTSKARLYHYYPSKDAILFDLLDRYTRRLILITDGVRALARNGLPPREEMRELIRAFLAEYQTSRFRHAALLNDVKFLAPPQRLRIIEQQRTVVSVFAFTLERAFPEQVANANAKPVAMMLLGMINWTFTWMKPDGPMSYAEFAEQVIAVCFGGIAGLPAVAGATAMNPVLKYSDNGVSDSESGKNGSAHNGTG